MNLSVVIPSHNRPDLLAVCLRSVVDCAPVGTEVIVVDDGSRGAVIAGVAATFPGVRVVRQVCRSGFCAAANRGIDAAQGDFIELLNDDTAVTAGWALSALAEFADPTVAAVAPLVLLGTAGSPAQARIDSAGDRYYLGGVAGKRGHGQALTAAYLHPCPVFGASGSSAFYRRAALRQVGGFAEEFGAYFEDVDLAFRLHRAGYRIVYQPRSRVFHRVAASHGRTRRRLLEQQSLNEERVFWRNLPARDLLRALPRHALVLAAKAWRRTQEGQLTPFLFGRLRLLAELRTLARHRSDLRRLGPDSSASAWHVESRFWE